mmetsp:Transcript_103514/g.302065  ORF Transcript_103514/g.302065 Transcript_103514/m.302065 type:complete len:285 (-) Transcript_103514:12-866(-)
MGDPFSERLWMSMLPSEAIEAPQEAMPAPLLPCTWNVTCTCASCSPFMLIEEYAWLMTVPHFTSDPKRPLRAIAACARLMTDVTSPWASLSMPPKCWNKGMRRPPTSPPRSPGLPLSASASADPSLRRVMPNSDLTPFPIRWKKPSSLPLPSCLRRSAWPSSDLRSIRGAPCRNLAGGELGGSTAVLKSSQPEPRLARAAGTHASLGGAPLWRTAVGPVAKHGPALEGRLGNSTAAIKAMTTLVPREVRPPHIHDHLASTRELMPRRCISCTLMGRRWWARLSS